MLNHGLTVHIWNRLIILTTLDTASGKIFEQFENAQGLVKLLTATDKQIKNLRSEKQINYATHLLPMSRVLVMLASIYEKVDHIHREALRKISCAILEEYRDLPFGRSEEGEEEVAQSLGNAINILELLVMRCGKLTFSPETGAFISSSPITDSSLEVLLQNLFGDRFFCDSMRILMSRTEESSIKVFSRICRLIQCLIYADRLCVDEANNKRQGSRVIDSIFSSSPELLLLLLEKLLRLLEREIEELHTSPIAALHRLCSIVSILQVVLPQYDPSSTVSNNPALSRSFISLGKWMKHVRCNHPSCSSVQVLLQALVDESVKLLSADSPLLASLMMSDPPEERSDIISVADVDLLTEVALLRTEVANLRREKAGMV
jgi:hypothetical protein